MWDGNTPLALALALSRLGPNPQLCPISNVIISNLHLKPRNDTLSEFTHAVSLESPVVAQGPFGSVPVSARLWEIVRRLLLRLDGSDAPQKRSPTLHRFSTRLLLTLRMQDTSTILRRVIVISRHHAVTS